MRAANSLRYAVAVWLNILVVGSPPAIANSICNLVQTTKGHVALRIAPKATARIVIRMRSGFEVRTSGEPEDRSGSWLRVLYWLDRKHPDAYVPGRTRHGWVMDTYLRHCDA